jgi:hypothetical protein
MMPIRRGDGTGLSVPGFSEVRTGDGTVLWSAGGGIPDSVVDDFESNRQSNYDGSTGKASIVTSPVVEGSQALEIADGAFGDGITSTSGLPDDPEQGDTMQCWVYLTNSSQNASFIYYADEETTFPSNRYEVTIDADADTFGVVRDNTPFAASDHLNEWLRIIGTWRDDNVHSFSLEDSSGNELVTHEVTDSEYDGASGVGVGFRNGNAANQSAPMYFDGCFTTT